MRDPGLYLHRSGMIVLAPFLWMFATAALICASPFEAAEMVWSSGLKKHWNDK